MTENCSDIKYCEVALKLEEIHGDIKSKLSSGEEIMKSLKSQQDAFLDRIDRMFEKHDRRIEIVEKKVWYVSGAASAVTAAIMAGITKLFGGGHG